MQSFLPTRVRHLPLAVVAGAILVACGSSTTSSAENTMIVQYSNSGEPVSGALVSPLIANAVGNDPPLFFAPDPNNESTTTLADGSFQLDYRVPPVRAGVEITIDVSGPGGTAVGHFDFRTEIDLENRQGIVSIPEPTRCTTDVDCGEELLPDLTPIVRLSDLGPAASERLVVPDEAPRSADIFPNGTWFIDDASDRRLLRFPTVAANIGQGPLDVIAEGIDNDGVTTTFQRIWTDTWHFEDVESGEFVFHPTHDHIHFDAFEQYRLIDESGNVVAMAEKVSFCLRDSILIAEETPQATGVVFTADEDCGGNQQIINPGFGDHYHSLLDDQWIDISDVDAGDYTVEVVVDPFNVIVEADEKNNTARFDVVID